MADTKISGLPASTTPLAGTEVLPIVQGGVTKKVSVADLTTGRAPSVSGLTVSGLTASTALALNASKELVSVTNTGTGDNVLATAPTLVGNVTLSTGNLVVADTKGIDFSATPGTGTSELLDDYEEGTWTPIFEPAAGAFGSITYTGVTGFYTKIGNVVYVVGTLATDAVTIGTASGQLFMGGLPFGAGQSSVLAVSWSQDFATGNPSAIGVRGATLTHARIFYRTAASGPALTIDPSFLQNGVGKNFIQFAGCYIAS